MRYLSFCILLIVVFLEKPAQGLRQSQITSAHRSGGELRLNLFDKVAEVAADPVSTQGVAAGVQAFFDTVASRVTGVIIGNVVAGAVLKIGADILRNKADEKRNSERKRVDEGELSGSTSIPGEAWAKLLACIMIDFLGDASFAFPGIGEVEDLAWAPLSGLAVRALFGSNAIAGLDAVKEALPGTDFIPVATLAWALTYILPGNPVAAAIGLPDVSKKKAKGKGKGK